MYIYCHQLLLSIITKNIFFHSIFLHLSLKITLESLNGNIYKFIAVSFFKGHADEISSMRHTGYPTDQKFLEW